MLSRKTFVVSACAAVMFASIGARPAVAQGPIDSRTEFTFNVPVEMPGVTLPPGAYVFRFADSTTGRKVMQVMSKDGSNKTYGLFMTISAQRPKASDDAELRFIETPAGKPAAVKTWWYPGTTIGREFIYPKEQARRLAQANKTTVLTTTAQNVSSEQMASADLAYVSPSGEETKAMDQMVDAAATTTPTSARTPVQEGTSASNATGTAGSRRSLPRTNGLLPLLALIGAGSMAGGVGLRFRR